MVDIMPTKMEGLNWLNNKNEATTLFQNKVEGPTTVIMDCSFVILLKDFQQKE